MAKMKSINQDTHAKIEAVLTDEQKKQWAEMQAQQTRKNAAAHAGAWRRHGNGCTPASSARSITKLNMRSRTERPPSQLEGGRVVSGALLLLGWLPQL